MYSNALKVTFRPRVAVVDEVVERRPLVEAEGVDQVVIGRGVLQDAVGLRQGAGHSRRSSSARLPVRM